MDIPRYRPTLFWPILCLLPLLPPKALAQIEGNNPILHDAINDAYIVGGSGVVGAILGLSTLSFLEKPEKHLKNIVVGGSLGIIVGVGVVAWGQANKSRRSMGGPHLREAPPKAFSTAKRYAWHYQKHRRPSQGTYSFQYRFEF